MSTGFKRVAVIATRSGGILALACLATTSAAAQRLSLPRDSITRLAAPLAPAAKSAVDAYLGATVDSVARNRLRAIQADPNGGPFILAVIAGDATERIRLDMISSIRYSPDRWLNVPGTMAALVGRVANDRSAAVAAAASMAARIFSLSSSGLRTAVASRISAARSSGDTAMLRFALEEDELLVHMEQPMYAPPFVRTAPGPFAAVPAGRSIRFSVFGDYGVLHLAKRPDFPYAQHQSDVAAALKAYHAKHRLDFGITTGDNFYPTSFPSATDPSWDISWAGLYDALGIPFYIALGNHDWGEPAGPLSEHIYGKTSPSWRLPAFYYTYTAGPAQLFAINTNELTERQLTWLKDELAKSKAKWKIVYGHFPVYEQTDYSVAPQQEKVMPILRQFGVDAYFAGHHHTMQHWAIDGIDYFVSGAGGATNYSLGDTTKSSTGRRFAKSVPGFGVVEANDGSLTVRFIGKGGEMLYEYTRRK